MKKKLIAGVFAATAVVLGTALPAAAEITVTPPHGASLYVVTVDSGQINAIDSVTGDITPIATALAGDTWTTGADYDPTTNTVVYISDWSLGAAQIVVVDLSDNSFVAYPLNLNGEATRNYEPRGIDITPSGIVTILADIDGARAKLYVVELDETSGEYVNTSTVPGLTIPRSPSAVAWNSVTESYLFLTYDCEVVDADGTDLGNLRDYIEAPSECSALDIDSAGRAWATVTVGILATWDTAGALSEVERSTWVKDEATEYGEAVFVGPGDVVIAPVAPELASTGTSQGGPFTAVFVALSVLTLGFVIRRRATR